MDNSIIDLWENNKEVFQSKTVEQILLFCGDGKLRDNSSTSHEFRSFLSNISSKYLVKYAEECLTSSYKDGGLILQDIINQIGLRLGFNVEDGLYRGTRNKSNIGYDGIWSLKDGYEMVVEVKTTDTYRINLDTVASYRNRLIEENRISKRMSSILIVVGRQDTGDLEAQIRGSKHAWDIRLISTDALLKLMMLKENLNDTRTSLQINEILKPMEYTRVDLLINIIFNTTEDLQIDTDTDVEQDNSIDLNALPQRENNSKSKTVEFREECVAIIEKKLKATFIKQGRCLYSSVQNDCRLVCVISKRYKLKNSNRYWFAFHPPQKEFLKEAKNGYVAFGCGSSDLTVLMPFPKFEECLEKLGQTHKENGRFYWHIEIFEKNKNYSIRQNHAEDIPVNEFLVN
ncbi:hypothetical protein P8917_03935 [Bacillus atrophaeus]|uniref:hypothetical protein n=1 Tax=Bacillus atrophaeus TaxID=1452 RepID=UPI00227FF900|nr:hypothetical protein [Bacillus atrophaeus]MCY8498568.1 hypothetical protein [Bacillus atrophaeus]MCY8811600.1 hypothetical protein [Bacillus atrophaeus]MCY8819316.1 hypothetical protein [Bacillus atrophaeus]MCY8830336.1 hypothetical protein [Bacillus atrophaeus]MCY8832316.1 hypothetical protein [Bacillus atrophaeus]